MLMVNINNILLNHVIISADYPLKFGYLLVVLLPNNPRSGLKIRKPTRLNWLKAPTVGLHM